MSSRKEKNKHNMFEDSQLDNLQRKEVELAEYALNEKMTIPDFDNKINKDSAWSQKKNTE